MFDSIRKSIFTKALKQLLASSSRKRRLFTPETARNIHILFDASEESTRQEVAKIVEDFRKKGKQVQVLAFYNQKQLPENPPFEAFSLKETTWSGQPKSDKANTFAQASTDLLLVFNPELLPALSWVAAASVASMKVGYVADMPQDYDLQLDLPKGKGPRFFMDELSKYAQTLH